MFEEKVPSTRLYTKILKVKPTIKNQTQEHLPTKIEAKQFHKRFGSQFTDFRLQCLRDCGDGHERTGLKFFNHKIYAHIYLPTGDAFPFGVYDVPKAQILWKLKNALGPWVMTENGLVYAKLSTLLVERDLQREKDVTLSFSKDSITHLENLDCYKNVVLVQTVRGVQLVDTKSGILAGSIKNVHYLDQQQCQLLCTSRDAIQLYDIRRLDFPLASSPVNIETFVSAKLLCKENVALLHTNKLVVKPTVNFCMDEDILDERICAKKSWTMVSRTNDRQTLLVPNLDSLTQSVHYVEYGLKGTSYQRVGPLFGAESTAQMWLQESSFWRLVEEGDRFFLQFYCSPEVETRKIEYSSYRTIR